MEGHTLSMWMFTRANDYCFDKINNLPLSIPDCSIFHGSAARTNELDQVELVQDSHLWY